MFSSTSYHTHIALTLLLSCLVCISAEFIDSDDFERYCFPDEHRNTRKSCECSYESAPPWGLRALRLDCSYKNFKLQDFSSEVLPLYSETLDISWNSLERVPFLDSDSLRLLNLMHNNISTIVSKNFVKISNLRELYLSWNSIQVIELNAFDDLAHLQVLELSHNNLHALHFQVFGPMWILERLSLSWNRLLNQSEGIQELNFYDTFGVNRKLQKLELEACNLANVVLGETIHLLELDLRRNVLTKVPANLPSSLVKLDLSNNLFETLTPADTALIPPGIHELQLEDMPELKSIEENAFVPLQSLQKVSFQNSRHLNAIHEYAFGMNSTTTKTAQMPSLTALIFRGTSLRSFNATLAPVFLQLTELDLNGVPLHCDCELIWMKQLKMETQARCFKPSRIRGVMLSQMEPNDFRCDSWPRWIYGIILLSLICLCGGGIYFVVMGLRPHRGVTMRRKVGAGSPYARVTIEPNRQENLT